MPDQLVFVSFYGCVAAVQKQTGLSVWEVPVKSGRKQMMARGGRVYVASDGDGLLVLAAADGAVLNKSPISGRGQAPTLMVDEDGVFVTAGGVLQAFDLEGNPRWTNQFKGKGNGAVGMATMNWNRQPDEY